MSVDDPMENKQRYHGSYYVSICSTYKEYVPFELDFRVTQVLTDSSGISRYGNSGSILKNRKIGALTNKSESAVVTFIHPRAL